MTFSSRQTLFLSLGVVVFGAKLAKIAISYLKYLPGERVAVAVSVLGAAGVGGVVVAAWLLKRIRRDYDGMSYAAAVAAVTVVLLLVMETIIAAVFGGYKGIVQKGLALFSWDALLVIGFVLVATPLLNVGRRTYRLLATTVVYAVAWVLMTATLADLSFFITTGTNANWHLLQFVFRNAGLALPAVASGISAVQLGLIALPFLVLAFSAITGKRDKRTVYLNRQVSDESVRWLVGLGVIFLASTFFVSDRVATDISRPFVRNPIIDMVRDAVRTPVWARTEVGSDLPEPILPAYPDSSVLSAATAARPNVVLVIVESGRASSMPPFGTPAGVMPFLEEIAQRSLVVDRVYPTTPCTSESLISLLYGVYPPMTARLTYSEIRRPSWPSLLGGLGYRSAFFSAVDFVASRGERQMIENMGFETVRDGQDLSTDGTGRLNYSGAADEVFVSPGLAWLDEVAGTNTPFFVAFHTNASHHPYTLPESYDAMQVFDSDETYNRYLNTLRYTDGILERLFDEFEARQWIDDTIFVIVGDHGELFGSHGATFPHCHFLWEDAVRVPLIVHAPRYIRRQYVHPGPLQLVDVFPTVLDILRINVSGEAVLGISAADGLAREPVMLSASANQSMALMSDSLKYHYYFGREAMKVFNILSDPAEEIDLSGEISAEEKNAIVARLLNWRRAVNASYGL